MRVQNGKVAAQCDREFVILNAVKDLAFFIIRFFAKEAQNDRVCGLVILRNEGSGLQCLDSSQKRLE